MERVQLASGEGGRVTYDEKGMKKCMQSMAGKGSIWMKEGRGCAERCLGGRNAE